MNMTVCGTLMAPGRLTTTFLNDKGRKMIAEWDSDWQLWKDYNGNDVTDKVADHFSVCNTPKEAGE